MTIRTAMIAGILFLLGACQSPIRGKNGIIYKNAVQYNQYIMDNQKSVINVMLEFGQVIDQSLDSADQTLDRGVEKAEEALVNVEGMPPFHGDTAFRNAAIHSLEFYKDVLGNEYKKIVEIRRRKDNKTSDDLLFLQTLPEEIGKKEEKFDRDFHNAQQAFADKNHLTLVRNELQDKIDKQRKDD